MEAANALIQTLQRQIYHTVKLRSCNVQLDEAAEGVVCSFNNRRRGRR